MICQRNLHLVPLPIKYHFHGFSYAYILTILLTCFVSYVTLLVFILLISWLFFKKLCFFRDIKQKDLCVGFNYFHGTFIR